MKHISADILEENSKVDFPIIGRGDELEHIIQCGIEPLELVKVNNYGWGLIFLCLLPTGIIIGDLIGDICIILSILMPLLLCIYKIIKRRWIIYKLGYLNMSSIFWGNLPYLDEIIKETLKLRPPFSHKIFRSYWNDNELVETALRIHQIIVSENWNTDTIFHPDDDFCVMIRKHMKNEYELNSIVEICEQYPLNISEQKLIEILAKRPTFIEIVRIIVYNKTQSSER